MVAAAGLFSTLLLLAASGWAPLMEFDRRAVGIVHENIMENLAAAGVARGLTQIGGGEFSFLALSLVVVWLVIRKAHRAAVFVAVSGVGALIFDEGVKALVGRVRPVFQASVVTATGPSFPSGHALNATITFGLLLLVLLPMVPQRRRRVAGGVTVAVVAVIGLTRVALGVHYPSDVVAGWALGVAWLGITNRAFLRQEPPGRRRQAEETVFEPVPEGRSPLPDGWQSAALLTGVGVLLWGALLVMGELVSDPRGVVVRLDAMVLEWMVSVRRSALTDILSFVGRFGGTLAVAVALCASITAAVAALRRWRPALFLAVAVGGETALFLATASIVERARPEQTLTSELPPTTSFPSGHVAAAAAMYGSAALLVWLWRRDWLGAVAIVVAALVVLGVGLSRLYRGVHYFTDVVASVTYAALWVAVCWRVIRPHPERTAAPVAQREEGE